MWRSCRGFSIIKRGEIYIVNFGKKYNSEFGKKRPALIIQNNIANRNIDKVEFKGVSVIPLSTNITTGNLRVFINGRDNLLKRERKKFCVSYH